jgi:hypothetical protein
MTKMQKYKEKGTRQKEERATTKLNGRRPAVPGRMFEARMKRSIIKVECFAPQGRVSASGVMTEHVEMVKMRPLFTFLATPRQRY